MSYQFVKDTGVKLHLSSAALPEVVVVVVKTFPVGLELVKAVGIDVLDAVTGSISPSQPKDELQKQHTR